MDFAKALLKAPARTLLLLAAVVCVLLSLFEKVDKEGWRVAPRHDVFWWGLGIGTLFVLAAAFSFLIPWWLEHRWLGAASAGVQQHGDGWRCRVGQTDVVVRFGRLEDVAAVAEDAIVLLPANEFFDDACVTDSKSTLGAFAKRHFDGREPRLLDEVRQRLASQPKTPVVLDGGTTKHSFAVGTAVYLRRALETHWNVLVAAVTTDRPREGLKAEIRTLFTVVQELRATMATHRLHEAILPLLGAGHGGMRPRAALSALLVALIETLQRPDAHTMKSVTIVVYRHDPTADPLIPKRQVRELMGRALNIYCQTA